MLTPSSVSPSTSVPPPAASFSDESLTTSQPPNKFEFQKQDEYERAQAIIKSLKDEPGEVGSLFRNADNIRYVEVTRADGAVVGLWEIPETQDTPAIRLGSRETLGLAPGVGASYAQDANVIEMPIPERGADGRIEYSARERENDVTTLAHEQLHYKGEHEYGAYKDTYNRTNPELKDGRHYNDLSEDEQRDFILKNIMSAGIYDKGEYISATLEAFNGEINEKSLQYLPGGEKYIAMRDENFPADLDKASATEIEKQFLAEREPGYSVEADLDLKKGFRSYAYWTNHEFGEHKYDWSKRPLMDREERPEVVSEVRNKTIEMLLRYKSLRDESQNAAA